MKKRKRTGFAFTVFAACLVSAAATAMFLGYAAHAARIRVAGQYVTPDYIRYMSQGFELDAVSRKKNILMTVADGDIPERIHLLTLDADKHTLDILEIPPDSFIVADGYTGTVGGAYKSAAYRGIIERTLCIAIDGSFSLDCEAFGGAAKLLGAADGYGEGKVLSADGGCYSRGDKEAVGEYRELLAKMLEKIYENGAAKTFTALMNLAANRVEGDMSIEEAIELLNGICEVKPKKANIYIARGSPAKFGDGVIWCLDPEGNAELLNSRFRIKDAVFLPEALGMPKVETGEFPYKDLKEKVSEII